MTPISTILKQVSDANTIDKRVEILKAYDSDALRTVLICMFKKDVKFDLPPGPMPVGTWKPNEFDEPLRLYKEIKKFYLFVPELSPTVKTAKRQEVFMNMMNSLSKEEGELVIQVKDKKPPKNITEVLVKKAFPDLL